MNDVGCPVSRRGSEQGEVAITIDLVTTKERLHKLVDELTEAEAQNARIVVEDAHTAAGKKREIDRAIVESYTRVPQEDLGATWAARQSIREEPWTRTP